jgi:hypothetical protein
MKRKVEKAKLFSTTLNLKQFFFVLTDVKVSGCEGCDAQQKKILT